MATAKQKAWRAKFARMFGGKKKRSRTNKKTGGKMAKRSKKSFSSGGFGTKAIFPLSGILGGAVLGLGAAALAKRFIGAPLGNFTGAASGFAVGGIGGAIGGYIHDNIGNVGGASNGNLADSGGF